MKFYFASRIKNKEKILKISEVLKKNKHSVVSSWLQTPSLKPYEKNKKSCKLMAKKIEHEIKKSDVFVLISDRAGTDMFVELGIAISLNKKIYIIGKWNKRSLMHFHPLINHISSVKELLNTI